MAQKLPDALRQPVTDLASGKAWLDALISAGLSFHLEDDPATIEDGSGAAIFTRRDVPVIRAAVRALYGLTWGPDDSDYCPIGYLIHREGGLCTPEDKDADPANYFERCEIAYRGDTFIITDRAGGDPSYDYGAPDRYQWRDMPSGKVRDTFGLRRDAVTCAMAQTFPTSVCSCPITPELLAGFDAFWSRPTTEAERVGDFAHGYEMAARRAYGAGLLDARADHDSCPWAQFSPAWEEWGDGFNEAHTLDSSL